MLHEHVVNRLVELSGQSHPKARKTYEALVNRTATHPGQPFFVSSKRMTYWDKEKKKARKLTCDELVIPGLVSKTPYENGKRSYGLMLHGKALTDIIREAPRVRADSRKETKPTTPAPLCSNGLPNGGLALTVTPWRHADCERIRKGLSLAIEALDADEDQDTAAVLRLYFETLHEQVGDPMLYKQAGGMFFNPWQNIPKRYQGIILNGYHNYDCKDAHATVLKDVTGLELDDVDRVAQELGLPRDMVKKARIMRLNGSSLSLLFCDVGRAILGFYQGDKKRAQAVIDVLKKRFTAKAGWFQLQWTTSRFMLKVIEICREEGIDIIAYMHDGLVTVQEIPAWVFRMAADHEGLPSMIVREKPLS